MHVKPTGSGHVSILQELFGNGEGVTTRILLNLLNDGPQVNRTKHNNKKHTRPFASSSSNCRLKKVPKKLAYKI